MSDDRKLTPHEVVYGLGDRVGRNPGRGRAARVARDGDRITPPMRVQAPDRQNVYREIELRSVLQLREWLHRGEVGGNNRGDFVTYLTHGFEGSWCSALQWKAQDVACEALGWINPIPWQRKVNSARWLLKAIAGVGRYLDIEEIRAGHYICKPRTLAWQGHALRAADGRFPHLLLIDGNVGSFARTRGRVREIEVDVRKLDIVGAATLVRP